MKNQTSQYWFQTSKFKIILIVAAVVAVILVVMFSEQIGNLLDRDASKAGIGTTISLDSSDFADFAGSQDLIFNPGSGVLGRLELVPWGQGPSD